MTLRPIVRALVVPVLGLSLKPAPPEPFLPEDPALPSGACSDCPGAGTEELLDVDGRAVPFCPACKARLGCPLCRRRLAGVRGRRGSETFVCSECY
jgi:hypothetical protein